MSANPGVAAAAGPGGNVVREALGLLLSFPWRFLGLFVLWLLLVEALMLVPFLGFVFKLGLAGITMASLAFVLGRMAEDQAPRLRDLAWGLRLPLRTQALLALASLLPFAAGLAVLSLAQGRDAVSFFFSAAPLLGTMSPPSPWAMVSMKAAIYVASLVFTFLPMAAAAEPGQDPGELQRKSLAALRRFWLQVVLMVGFAFTLEVLAVTLALGPPGLGSKFGAGVLQLALLLIWMPLSLAITVLLYQRSRA